MSLRWKTESYGIDLRIGDTLKYGKDYLKSSKNLHQEITGKIIFDEVFYTLEDAIKGIESGEVTLKREEVTKDAEFKVRGSVEHPLSDLLIMEIFDENELKGFIRVSTQETYSYLNKNLLYIQDNQDHSGMIQNPVTGEWRWF